MITEKKEPIEPIKTKEMKPVRAMARRVESTPHIKPLKTAETKVETVPEEKPITSESIPKEDTKPIEKPEPKTRFTQGEILKTLSSLPKGLPSELWEYDMDDLATKISQAEYVSTPSNDLVVNIDGEWFYGNPKKIGKYLQRYKGQIVKEKKVVGDRD